MPRIKRRQGAVALMSVAAAALFAGLMNLGAAPAASAQKDGDLPAEFAFLRSDAACYVQVRVGDWWTSDLGKQLRAAAPHAYRLATQSCDFLFGVAPEEVEMLLIATDHTPSILDFLVADLGRRQDSQSATSRADNPKAKVENRDAKDSGKTKPDDNPKKEPDKDPPPDSKKGFQPPSNAPARAADSGDDPAREMGGTVMVVTMTDAKVLARARAHAAKDAAAIQYKGKTIFVRKAMQDDALFFLGERSLVRAPIALIRRGIDVLDDIPSTNRLRALAKQGSTHLWIDSKRFATGLADELGEHSQFRFLAQKALAPLNLCKGKQVAVQFGKETKATIAVSFAGQAEAKAAMEPLEDYLTLFRLVELGEVNVALLRLLDEADDERQEVAVAASLLYFERLAKALRQVTVKQVGNKLQVEVAADTDMTDLAKLALAFVTERRGDPQTQLATAMKKSRKNLAQIGLALHNHHDAYKRFPPQGSPGLSWRVAILPFLEDGALYNEFKLQEPWDSPHNIKLLEKMPKVYAVPGAKTEKPGWTYYQGFVGRGAGWEPVGPDGKPGHMIRMIDITDGTANTIMVIEAGAPVPWTKPADLPFEQGKPLPKIGGPYKTKANVLLFDGSVHVLPTTVPPEILSAMITRAGGEAISYEFDRK
jgi:hypothetical protein